jgi:hypothetical protein
MRKWAQDLNVDPDSILMLGDADASFHRAIGKCCPCYTVFRDFLMVANRVIVMPCYDVIRDY